MWSQEGQPGAHWLHLLKILRLLFTKMRQNNVTSQQVPAVSNTVLEMKIFLIDIKRWYLSYQTIFSNKILHIFHRILQNQVYKINTGWVQIKHFYCTLYRVYFFMYVSVCNIKLTKDVTKTTYWDDCQFTRTTRCPEVLQQYFLQLSAKKEVCMTHARRLKTLSAHNVH